MTFDEIISRFTVKSKTSSGIKCLCPCHDDKKASLSISKGSNGKILMHDFAGCSTLDILEKVGLKWADLYLDGTDNRESWQRYVEGREKRQIEAEYHYVDPVSSEYRFTRLRMTGKDFKYGRLQNGRFNYGLNGKQRKSIPAIFTESVKGIRDAVEAGKQICYSEGEKDVLTLQHHGYAAFTCGGTSDWNPACAELVRDAHVVVFGDNDPPGRKLAEQIKNDMLSVAADVKIVYPDQTRKGGDVSDFFADGHTKEELDKLIAESEVAVPDQDSEDRQIDSAGLSDMIAPADLDQFHLINGKGVPTGVFDLAIFNYLKQTENIFIMGGTPYIYNHGVYRADVSGSALKTLIRRLIYPQFVKAPTIKRIYDLFLSADELQIAFSQVNRFPCSWINFRNGVYDPIECRMVRHDPKYLAINQIPHDYDPDVELTGPELDEWLRSIVEDEEDREMLLQYAGYCMTRDCRQQKCLILCGEGGTGKSTMIRAIESIIGQENTANISLTELNQRFASFGLMGKQLNSCADLEIKALEDTSLLKKALGEDMIRAEQKGHDAISFRNYARLIFSTNELPIVKYENTNGFYRRLLILNMNKIPPKGRADFFEGLLSEIGYLIQLSVKALERMYKNGHILESANSKKAVKRFRCDSDPVESFIEDETIIGRELKEERTKLFDAYSNYCCNQGTKPLSPHKFYSVLETKGYHSVKNSTYYIKGIELHEPGPMIPMGSVIVKDTILPFSN